MLTGPSRLIPPGKNGTINKIGIHFIEHAAILEETLDIAQSAENVSFRKKGSLIEISYDLKDRTHVLSYDPETGISKEI